MNNDTIQDTLETSFDTERSPKIEGHLTKSVENQTAKAPSITWLGLAIGSMALSAGFQLFSKKKELGTFVGLWAPCFLMVGLYNKIVKVNGNDQIERSSFESMH